MSPRPAPPHPPHILPSGVVIPPLHLLPFGILLSNCLRSFHGRGALSLPNRSLSCRGQSCDRIFIERDAPLSCHPLSMLPILILYFLHSSLCPVHPGSRFPHWVSLPYFFKLFIPSPLQSYSISTSPPALVLLFPPLGGLSQGDSLL